MNTSDDVLYEVREDAAWITINRPEASNAVSLAAGADICDFLGQADRDPAVRAIVLTGAGEKVFSAGADLQELPPTRHDPEEAKAYDRAFDSPMLAIEKCTKPTIARLNGHVVGGSLAMAMACDIRVAVERARFRIPVASLGFMYTPAQTARIIRSIGPARTKTMMFTARPIPSDQALAWGLVQYVQPDNEFDQFVETLVHDICNGAPLTNTTMKMFVDRIAAGDPLDAEAISAAYLRVYGSDDLKEGLTAMAEKRAPSFKGE